MGAIAEAIAAYAQPLIDATDGSMERMETALGLGQICWNLALFSEDERAEALRRMRPTLKMDDEEFEEFQRSVLAPMIRRHEEMFPDMHRPRSMGPSREAPASRTRTEGGPKVGRNAPCPCNSGKKYKLCCGR